jgi:mannose-6-phosphate isomerase
VAEPPVEKPWGSYRVLEERPTYKVKRIEVHPGHRLSYQRHAHRAEHWFVIAGTARVTLDGEQQEVSSGRAVDIPVRSAHRVENPGDGSLVLIEVQTGDYFGEDDIERLSDDYGRVG